MELTRLHALAGALALTILAALVSAAPARAQTYDPSYPICLQTFDVDGGYIECRYASLGQCAASASGRAATCVVNPYPAKSNTEPGPHQKQSRMH